MRKGDEEDSFPIRTVIASPDSQLLVNLAAAGHGIAIGSPLYCSHKIDAGALQPVLEGWTLPLGKLSLVWRRSRHLAPSVRAFIDHVSRQP